MDYNQAYQTILTWITDNNNKEITAAIMRDVLKTLLDFADENIGDTSLLFDKDNTVDAINELKSIVDNINISQPLVVHNGSDDPNVNPPANFNAPDIYVRVDGMLKKVYMYNGINWVEILTFKIPTRKDGLWLGNVSSLNFVGAEWQLTFDPVTGQLTMEIVGGGGGGQVDSVVGTAGQIDVDDADPENPVLSLATAVTDAISNIQADYVKSTADFNTAGRVVIVDSAGRKVVQGSKLLADLITEGENIGTARQYTAGQGTALGTLTIASGSVTPDIAAKNAYSLTIDQNVTINAPRNDRCTSWFIRCTIKGAGGWTIRLNAAYKPDGGAALTIPNTTGDKFTLYVQSFGDGTHDITIHTQQ